MKDFLRILKPCLIEVNETLVSSMISCTVRVEISYFTNGRHLNLSVVFVSQNLFYTGKKCITISLNSTDIVVFKNPRDPSQVRHLACQMFPSKPKYLQAAYEEETKDLYRYLFLDFHPNSPEFARVRENIFPHDCCLYLPKDMQI